MSNIPTLRFGEFDGEWSENFLGDVTDYTKGFAFKSYEYSNTGTRIIRVSDLSESSIKTDNSKVYIIDDKNKYLKYKIIQDNIIITTVGSNPDLKESAVGRAIYINENDIGLLNQNMLKLENTNKSNNKFIHALLNTPRYIFFMKAIKRGNANQANITVKELFKFKINLPTKPEQQKIATFLTAVDSSIEQLSQKEQLLRSYKKGVMQKIFSREIRFTPSTSSGNGKTENLVTEAVEVEDGGVFEDWVEKRLGDIGNFKSGTGFSEKEQGGTVGVPFYKVSDMNLRENKITMNIANNYVTTEQISHLKLKPIESDAIIFAKVGAAIFLERKRKAKNFLIDNNMMAFIPTCNIEFITQYFYTIRLSKYAQVGALPSYNATDLKGIKINLPSLPEQTKIANFLSSLDKQIAQVSEQLAKKKDFKKGLLQKMFV